MMGDHHWKGTKAILCALLFCIYFFSGCAGWLSSGGGLGSPDPVINTPATPDNPTPDAGADVTFSVSAVEPQGQALTYTWSDNGAGGTFTGTGDTVTWMIATAGTYTITVTVTNSGGNEATSSFTIEVVEPGAIVITTDPQTGYVGKATCLGCHSSVIDETAFNNHRHNHKLNPATSDFIGAWWTGSSVFDTINMDFGTEGANYVATIDGEDHTIVRTLGWGFEKWKQRYIVKVGNSWYITPAQHNMVTDEWVSYHPGDWDSGMPTGPANSYDRRCMGCHNTGGNVEFSVETGEWVMGVSEENVQCEACHGPGADHANAPSHDNIVHPTDIEDYDRQLEVCGSCHGRGHSVMELGGSTMGYPFNAAGQNFRPGDNLDDFYVQDPGLWPDGHSKKHHQQFIDYKLSAHYGTGFVTCTSCHNVHEPDADFTNETCTGCHGAIGADLAAHTRHATDKLCIDCHMPFTAKSAIAYDIRSHAFDIISPQVSMDNFLADPTNVIPNSCMNGGCHGGKDALTDEALIQERLDAFNTLWP